MGLEAAMVVALVIVLVLAAYTGNAPTLKLMINTPNLWLMLTSYGLRFRRRRIDGGYKRLQKSYQVLFILGDFARRLSGTFEFR